MLNSESDHCLSVGLEHSRLALLPTIFNRQPCSALALGSFLAEWESTLMDTSSVLCYSVSLSYHFQCTLHALRNSHNAPPHLFKAFSPYSISPPTLEVIPFNNICLYASSIFARCLRSELSRIQQQDWPVTDTMFSPLSTAVWAPWLSGQYTSIPFICMT